MEKIKMDSLYEGMIVRQIFDNAIRKANENLFSGLNDDYLKALLIIIEAEIKSNLFEKEEK